MRKDNDALAQRKKQVETKVIEEEAEVHDFAINVIINRINIRSVAYTITTHFTIFFLPT
jgi:hypothetical protein